MRYVHPPSSDPFGITFSLRGEGKELGLDEARHFAWALRSGGTNPETVMWEMLRGRRLLGFKFRRQHPMPPYALDFYCPQLRLAVEIDGLHHAHSEQDRHRDAAFTAGGILTLRFWNHDVLQHPDLVHRHLTTAIQQRASALTFSP